MDRHWTEVEIALVFEQLRIVSAQLHHLILKVNYMSDATDAAIAQLQADVAQLADTDAAAVTLLNGLSQQLKDALDAARNQGATPAQLAALNDLHATLSQKTGELAAAVVANGLNPPTPPTTDTPPAGDDADVPPAETTDETPAPTTTGKSKS